MSRKERRIRDAGVHIGTMERGERNSLADVPGVRVGHVTMEEGSLRTGVTVIVPGAGNPFFAKPVAAVHVLNGYGKSLGLMQVQELGAIETPIALCGTLNVGLVHDALVTCALAGAEAEGRQPPTSINPVVLECNDGRLSEIARRPVGLRQVQAALCGARADFAQGSVGAGRGMICHGLKGGIGSASRVVPLGEDRYMLGVLALTNHGRLADLRIDGRLVGPALEGRVQTMDAPERGSVICVLATDLPVDARQLGRILRRVPVGLARVGAYVGHGSGEVMLGFTTACPLPFEEGPAVRTVHVAREDLLDGAFRAAAECCEEAVLNALYAAETTVGYRSDVAHSLHEIWPVQA